MDEMREKNWAELITMQQEQIRLLTPVQERARSGKRVASGHS